MDGASTVTVDGTSQPNRTHRLRSFTTPDLAPKMPDEKRRRSWGRADFLSVSHPAIVGSSVHPINMDSSDAYAAAYIPRHSGRVPRIARHDPWWIEGLCQRQYSITRARAQGARDYARRAH